MNFVPLSGDLPVSMNFWGFSKTMLDELAGRFGAWFDANVPGNPLKSEYFLPSVANAVIKEGLGSVRVLPCHETWHGVTYREDLPDVIEYIASLRREGKYGEKLLD